MASKYKTKFSDKDEEEVERTGLLGILKNIALKPFRIVLSKPALRAYLTTALIISTAIFLFATATTAYTLFYWSYVPRIGFAKDIHLQWDDLYQQRAVQAAETLPGSSAANVHINPFPHGTVELQGDLVSAQPYDIKLELTLPRTRSNREVGNFMLDVSLLAPAPSSKKRTGTANLLETVKEGLTPPTSPSDSAPVLARSRRPAILHYRSLLVEATHRMTQLPWYLLGVRSETETLSISVFEGASFARGANSVPAALRLEVQSSARMQIYTARAVFRARFGGLRWLMYNHRIFSMVIFVGVFWSVEMVCAGIAWAVLAAYLGPAMRMPMRIKEEEEASELGDSDEEGSNAFLSDTERTFPTLSGQQPLRFRSPDVIKEENKDDGTVEVRLEDVPPLPTALEADDEDDEEGDYFLDSGIGTSMESGGGSRPGSVRKRRGRSSFRE
ncbi:hypothetical protein Q7P37_003137 [Cladosporium fusiforme]